MGSESEKEDWLAAARSAMEIEAASLARAAARLDGELVFERGQAVAWREWLAWRAGRVKTVLVKHIGGACLSSDPLGCGAPAAAGAAP